MLARLPSPRPGRQAVGFDQVLVSQPIFLHSPDDLPHRLWRIHVALVVAARELLNVAVKVLRAHLVIRPVMAAREHRPERFDAVGVDLSADVFAYGVLHRAMVRQAPVARRLVGIDHRAMIDAGHGEALHYLPVGYGHDAGA